MSTLKSKYQQFIQKANIIIYGTNTFAGRLFDLILLALIMLSVAIVMLETVKGFDQKYHTIIIIFEWIFTIFFTIEYILRILILKQPKSYIFSFYGIIDLLSILPMYLTFFISGTSIFAALRVLRMLRLFKILNLPQFNHHSKQLKDAIVSSRNKIMIFIYFMLISTVVIGTIMYFVEGQENGFTSIPASIYWAIVTLTTVGYGDISPATPLGQFIASIVMILGYGIIAVPTGIVTSQLISQKNNKSETEPIHCFSCGNQENIETAKFCNKCGHEL